MAGQITAKRTERAIMEDVAPAKPSPKVVAAKAEAERAGDLLDEIDALLDDEAQAALDEERNRASFREKLRSIGFLRRRGVPCSDLIRVPAGMAEEAAARYGVDVYDGPPCVGCE